MLPKSIYIASLQPRAGSLIISIGFMEMLKGRYQRVAFFRPIIPDGEMREGDIDFMLQHFGLDIPYAECCGFPVSDYAKAYAEESQEELYEALIHKVDQLHKHYDFVLIEGYPRNLFASVFDFDINLKIARNLGTVFIPVLNAKGKSSSKLIHEIQIISETVHTEGCTLLATFVNQCDSTVIGTIKAYLDAQTTEEQVYLLPTLEELETPTLAQVITVLQAKMLIGNPKQLEHLVYGNKIAAMGVENYLTRIKTGDLIIVPGDRIDIILASLFAFHAKNHPNISGMILSGGITPSPQIITLLEDFHTIPVPILSVESDSYQTAIALEHVTAEITPESTRKITLAKGLFDASVDKLKITQRFQHSPQEMVTPMMFQYRLFEQARSQRVRIVLPESSDVRILRATEILIHRDIVEVILLGDPLEIEHQSVLLGLNLSQTTIINPHDKALQEQFARRFYAIRRDKGLTLDVARDAMTHLNYFATMMVYEGMAEGMVSGAIHTTTDTVRPALQIIKTTPDISIVSSLFFMCLADRVLVYADCAINLDPSAEELAQIALSSAETASQFGITPKVAMLSYSTGSSGSGPEVEKVRRATQLAQTARPDLLIEGPIQYDAAIDPKVAQQKLPQSKVAGEATVFIFPNLNTGNNTYKAVQRATHALAIGPILQGLRLPINDLSRGCLVEDIVNTVAITAIQAQQEVQS